MAISCFFSRSVKAGELAALVRVEDLGLSVFRQCLLDSLDAVRRVHGYREPPGQHLAAEPVDHGHEIDEAARSRHHADLRQKFHLSRLSRYPEPPLWTGDITYVRTDEGWLYLAVVIDLFRWCRELHVGYTFTGLPHMCQCSLARGSYALSLSRTRSACPGISGSGAASSDLPPWPDAPDPANRVD